MKAMKELYLKNTHKLLKVQLISSFQAFIKSTLFKH